jgi:IS30 family transposase
LGCVFETASAYNAVGVGWSWRCILLLTVSSSKASWGGICEGLAFLVRQKRCLRRVVDGWGSLQISSLGGHRRFRVVLAELYMSQIVCLHGVPKKIVSDRGTQFTSHFWQQLHEALGTHLNFSSAYHPQTDGQTERTNQILEDMMRSYALQDQSGWDKRLPYT